MPTPPGYEDEQYIDFAVSPVFRAAFAEMGLTPRLPDGYPVERKPAWEPLPILDLNEREWEEMQDAIAQLLNLNNDEPEPPAPSPAVPTPVRPRPTPPPAASEPIAFPVPAPKLKGWWRHQ